MKKFLVIIAVLALTMISSVAMAEVTVDGSVEFLMRSFKNTTDWNDKTTNSGDYVNTYERIRIGVNAKHEGVKGRIQLDTDWDMWGDGASSASPNPGLETQPNKAFAFREGWLDMQLGVGTAHLKVGRQFLQLGNGWFLRSSKYGSDAWLLGLPGKNTVAFVNIKASENTTSSSDDTDAYALLDVFKIDDKNTVGVFIARADDRKGTWTNNAFAGGALFANNTILDNLGLHYSGKLGPINLQAEIDIQSGKIKQVNTANADIKFSGTQIVLQANMPIDPLTINLTIATGSGDKASSASKQEQIMTFLDKDPRYTMIYEYVMDTAAGYKQQHTGFANTQAIGIGAGYKVNKQIMVNLDAWMLTANEKVSIQDNPATLANEGGAPSDKLGTEVDLKITWTPYDQVSWYVNFGQFMTGDAYKSAAGIADNVTAIQSVLSYKF
jgi:hypothetical protein